MATKKKGGMAIESMTLDFLISPFKTAYIIFLIFLILIVSNVGLQFFLYQTSDVAIETIEAAIGREYSFLIFFSGDTFATTLLSNIQTAFHFVFFKMTGFEMLMQTKPEELNSFNQMAQKYLFNHYDTMRLLNSSKNLISLRLSFIASASVLAFLLQVVAIGDGLACRAIRTACAGRESSGNYHYAKWWRLGIISLSMSIYLVCPFFIHPALLALPIVTSAVLTQIQFKFWKKYL